MAHYTLDVSQKESMEFVKSMLEEFIPLFSSDKFNICCDETFDIGNGKSAKLAESLGVERMYVDFLKKIPENVVCPNWAYHSEVTEDNTETLAVAGVNQYVCLGVGGWNRIMNSMDSSFMNIKRMISHDKRLL